MSNLPSQGERAIEAAFSEDLAWGDVTTQPLVPEGLIGKGSLLVKAPGVLAGMEVAAAVFKRVDPGLAFQVLAPDGTKVEPGTVVGVVAGAVRSILVAERTALNFLTRLSGIATLTAQYVQTIAGLPCFILDTRKTAPGLRYWDKYAVRVGGGRNHRFHLGDGVLIKDNHWQALRLSGMSLKQGMERVRAQAHYLLKVEVEVKNEAEAREALAAGSDVLMLDNMGLAEMRRVVALARGKALVEASGGITLDNVRAVAETGVDFISVGALTHSVHALDISLELEYQP